MHSPYLGANYHLIRSIYRHRRNEYNSMPLNIAVTAPNWAWAQHTSQDASSYLVMRNQSVNLEQACVTHALLPPLCLGPHHARDRNIRRIKNLAWCHELMFYVSTEYPVLFRRQFHSHRSIWESLPKGGKKKKSHEDDSCIHN